MISPHTEDMDLIRRDRALPGLGLILDPGQLLERVSGHELFENVGDLELDYIRYKPGMNCLGRYRFRRDGDQFWAYAKAFSNASRPKLEKVMQRSAEAGGTAHSVVMQDWGVFVSVYPHDLKLRSISRLSEPALRQRLFRRVFEDPQPWLESQSAILNYKPERRLVLKLTAHDGRAATVKFHTRREYERLARNDRISRATVGISTPRRIGMSRKHLCQAFDWIDGETLRVLASNADARIGDHRSTGELIARFHGTDINPENVVTSRPVAPTLESLAQQLAILVPDASAEALALAGGLADLEQHNPARPSLIHGDFYDKQIIVHGEQVSLIDLDCAGPGDVHQDLACFLAHRERQFLNGSLSPRGPVSRAATAFLDGYLDAGGDFCEQRLRRWMAWHLLRLSHHPFRDRTPDWPDQVRAMLARASQLLNSNSAPIQIASVS